MRDPRLRPGVSCYTLIIMKKIIAALAATAAMLAMALTSTPAEATTWTSPPNGATKVVEANIGSGSECGGYSVGEPCLAKLKSVVTSYQPDVVFGEEFCYRDYVAFADFLHGLSLSWEVYYTPMTFTKVPLTNDGLPDDPTNGLGCPDGNGGYESKGQVLAGLNLYSQQEVELSSPTTTNQYRMTCAGNSAVTTKTPTRFCVVHLIAGEQNDSIKAAQAYAIQNDQELYGRPAIGGDFNLSLSDNVFNRYLHDSLPSASTWGSDQMMDPDSASHVDHNTFRLKSGMDSSATSVAPDNGWGGAPLSTHDLRKAWVIYN